MEAILQWDGQALLFIQEHIRQVWMDGFWKTITHLGDAGWLWIIFGIVLLIPKKTRKAGIAALAALAIGALITNVALKNIIARIRPYEVVEGLKLLIEPQSDFSFPSGHTCASIGAALAMYPFLERKWGIPLVILAVLISLSRLYVGVHYPTDVLGGAVVGAFAAWGAVRIVKRREIKGNREG
ncbi:MAG: phosphatase PAP2 family protein [[Ruminococcus] gnavus]|nr:phosphatase PAP2 family protein [Mediterraneibacter gnavus]